MVLKKRRNDHDRALARHMTDAIREEACASKVHRSACATLQGFERSLANCDASLTENSSMEASILSTLPAEVRNRIYELALVATRTINIWELSLNKPLWKAPALLHTCQQIRAEARYYYYALNTFRIFSTEPGHQATVDLLLSWITILELKDRKVVASVRLDDSLYPLAEIDGVVSAAKLALQRFGVAVENLRITVEALELRCYCGLDLWVGSREEAQKLLASDEPEH